MINPDNPAGHGPDAPAAETPPRATEHGASPPRAESPQSPRPGGNRHGDDAAVRVCAYCGAVLPAGSGRGGPKIKYCQDGTTWGTKHLTCKQAAQALDNVASLPGGDQRVLDDASVAELGEHVEAALSPVEQLRTALTAVRGDLDGAVTDALRDRDTAEQRARDAEERATLAEYRAGQAAETAQQAEEAADAAARLRGQAETERDAALADRDTATATQQRAEARLADARDREDRADRRAAEAGDRAAAAENQLATRTAERDTLSTQLAQAQASRDELQTRLDAERAQHVQARDQIRDEAHAEITRIREAAHTDIAAARAERDQAQRDHTAQLGDLRQQLGSCEQQVTSLDQRAETAETAHHRVTNQLDHWHRELTAALAHPGDHGQQLATRIEQLLTEDSGAV